MPDLVGDPRLADVDAPGPNPGNDSPDFPAWKAQADLWREWAQKQKDKVAELVTTAAQSGMDSDTALRNAGFENRKEYGMSMFSLFGNGGFFQREGSAADPNWVYDWSKGTKHKVAGLDDVGDIPINATEKLEHSKAQAYTKAGLQGYGQIQNAEKFNRIKAAHFQYDAKTGLYVNQGHAKTGDFANYEYKDQYGRTAKPPAGDLSHLANGASGTPPQGAPGAFDSQGNPISQEQYGSMLQSAGGGYDGMDNATQGFGLDRSQTSYLDQMSKRKYMNDLYGAALGVKFDPEGGGYSALADYSGAPADMTQGSLSPDGTLPGGDRQLTYDAQGNVIGGTGGVKPPSPGMPSLSPDQGTTYGQLAGQNPQGELPSNFNEAGYLAANPDVAAAIQAGTFKSGAEHFQKYGYKEGRPGVEGRMAPQAGEMQGTGGIKAPPVEGASPDFNPTPGGAGPYGGAIPPGTEPQGGTGGVKSPMEAPIEGFPGAPGQGGPYGGYNPSGAQTFDEAAYLQANPDVAAAVKAGTFKNGKEHFDKYGKDENRPGIGGPIRQPPQTGGQDPGGAVANEDPNQAGPALPPRQPPQTGGMTPPPSGGATANEDPHQAGGVSGYGGNGGNTPGLGSLNKQQSTVEAMFLTPQMEGIEKDLQDGIARLKAEGRPQDIPKLIEASQKNALSARQNLQQQALGYLGSEDPYKDLPGYQGDLQANTQKYIAEMSNRLGMSQLELQKYLGEMQNATQQQQIQMQHQLGLSDLDLKRMGLEMQNSQFGSDLELKNRQLALQDEWNKMGDKTTQRGQDIQKELQMLGYQQQEKAQHNAFYGQLGNTAATLLPKILPKIFGGGSSAASTALAPGLSGPVATGGASALGMVAPIAVGAGMSALGGYGGGQVAGQLGLPKNLGRVLGASNPMIGGPAAAYTFGRKLLGKIFSDETTKESIEVHSAGLPELLKMRPISFEYVDSKYGEKGTHYGVRAQELEKVIPLAVSKDEGTGKKMVDYGSILMTNVNATRELAEGLEKLEARLRASSYKSRKRGRS